MNGQAMRKALHNGERVYGTMVTAISPNWPNVVKAIGLDWAFIDTEHIAQDRAQLSWMCKLYAAVGVVPIVRIPSPDPYQAAMALDGGAQGVIAPYVETVEQVRALVGAVKLRPLKGDKLRGALSGERALEPDVSAFLQERNQGSVAIVNIESVAAMEALDEMLDVEGLDAVLIGPNDLSCNLGIPNQYYHPKFVDAVDTIISKARAKNIGAGIHMVYGDSTEGSHTGSAMTQEVRWAQMGANLIAHSIDVVAFRNGLRREFDEIKGALREGEGAPEMEAIEI